MLIDMKTIYFAFFLGKSIKKFYVNAFKDLKQLILKSLP